jgi:putative transposase
MLTLREREAAAKTADVYSKHGIGSATFYKYGGLDVSDAKRLKSLEDGKAKLENLLAEAMLNKAMLKDIASKKWRRPPPGERPSLTFGPRLGCPVLCCHGWPTALRAPHACSK